MINDSFDVLLVCVMVQSVHMVECAGARCTKKESFTLRKACTRARGAGTKPFSNCCNKLSMTILMIYCVDNISGSIELVCLSQPLIVCISGATLTLQVFCVHFCNKALSQTAL